MRIRIADSRSALHPSEVVVIVDTISGTESLVVDRQSLTDGFLEIGQPLGQEGRGVLVELPREANSGVWRVWVPQANVVPEAA